MAQKIKWRKSTYSGGDGNCIEIHESPAAVAVRDSKDKTGPTLAFTAQQWAAFVGFAREQAV